MEKKKISHAAFIFLDKFFTSFDEKLKYEINKNIEKVTQMTANITSSNVVPANTPRFPGSPQLPEERKIFLTYENMRWWIGSGWTHSTYPGERGPWTDYKGRIDAPLESFKLPSSEWQWADNWQVVKDAQTDDEGWGYAHDFLQTFHAVKHTLDFVRRRKWTRTCVKKSIINK